MRDNTVLSLDVDGLLADFDAGMRYKFNLPFEYYSEWDVPRLNLLFHYIENDYDFWVNLPVLNSPDKIDFKFDYYLTSIPYKMKNARYEWLMKNGYPDKPILVYNNKLHGCRDFNITHHVDDKHSTVIELNNNGIRCLKYIPYYMKEQPTEYDLHNFHLLKMFL